MGIEGIENLYPDSGLIESIEEESSSIDIDEDKSDKEHLSRLIQIQSQNTQNIKHSIKKVKIFKIGDIQIDKDKSEWVVVGVTHTGISRVRRNSLAHQVHAVSSPEIAKSLSVTNLLTVGIENV